MIEHGDYRIVNALLLFLPPVAIAFVWFNNRNQNIDISRNSCAKARDRFVAFMIDMVLCVLVVALVALLARLLGFRLIGWNSVIVFVSITWLYFAGMESSRKQATLGKMVTCIVVADLEGNRITFGRATVRFLASYISEMPLFLGFIMVLLTPFRQGFHDMLTGVLVLKKNRTP